MTENRENWLYSDASGLYFPHDGFIMRATDGKQYDIDEECELLNEYHKEYNECRDDVLRLEKENEQLKQQLKRCRNWINSDKNDYELTLAFIKNKGYSLKDVLEYEKELEE